MKDNVALLRSVNDMRKRKHELDRQIMLMDHYNKKDGPGFEEGLQNEQRKEIELMDMTIAKYQAELEQVQIEN